MAHSSTRRGLLALAAILLSVTTAFAQAAPSRSLKPINYPRWDAGGTFAIFGAKHTDVGSEWDGWEQQAEYRFDLGHYWTTHLKTEVGVSTTGAWEDFEQREAPIARSLLPGVSGGLTYVDIRKRLPAVTPSVTWQFRENKFMHPYVSAGMKAGFLQEHRTRPAGTYRINTVDGPISYSVTAVDERETTVLARPFVAGGFKSYFSRRVFLRSELQLAFARDGVSQAAVRAGVGVDF